MCCFRRGKLDAKRSATSTTPRELSKQSSPSRKPSASTSTTAGTSQPKPSTSAASRCTSNTKIHVHIMHAIRLWSFYAEFDAFYPVVYLLAQIFYAY